jgi:transcriptional regulator with XRE-family HTH domain
MSLHSKQYLRERLADSNFLDAYLSARIGQTIAAQVRVFRQRHGLSQTELAKELETSQNAIYRLENPKYIKHNVSKLKKIAERFKVGLVVRFAPLSEMVDWSNNLSETSIDVPDLDHDAGFGERKGAQSVVERTSGLQNNLHQAVGAETTKPPDVIGGGGGLFLVKSGQLGQEVTAGNKGSGLS